MVWYIFSINVFLWFRLGWNNDMCQKVVLRLNQLWKWNHLCCEPNNRLNNGKLTLILKLLRTRTLLPRIRTTEIFEPNLRPRGAPAELNRTGLLDCVEMRCFKALTICAFQLISGAFRKNMGALSWTTGSGLINIHVVFSSRMCDYLTNF